jgi:hypothetical protein
MHQAGCYAARLALLRPLAAEYLQRLDQAACALALLRGEEVAVAVQFLHQAQVRRSALTARTGYDQDGAETMFDRNLNTARHGPQRA